jgi:hypothetical protein
MAQYVLGSLALGWKITYTMRTRNNVKLAMANGPNMEYAACHVRLLVVSFLGAPVTSTIPPIHL